MKLLLLTSEIVMVIVLRISVSICGYDRQCPHSSQRGFRIRSECNGNSTVYNCLYNTKKKTYSEFCEKNEEARAGLKYVISGTYRNKECSEERYQPFTFWTNQSTDCLYLKAECSEAGQIVFDNSSTIVDSNCRCDYTRKYAFVSPPRNPCFCTPSMEDCSCYIKQCPNNTKLSPDYKCVYLNSTEISNCRPVNHTHANGTDKDTIQKDNECVYLNSTEKSFNCDPVIHTHTNGSDIDTVQKGTEKFQPWMKSLRTTLAVKIGCIALIAVILVVVIYDRKSRQGKRNTIGEISFIHLHNNFENNPLLDACQKGDLSLVARLIERGADINTTDKNEETPFSWSCKYGKIEIVNLLIDKGCDIHKPYNDGMTPLMNACHRSRDYLPIVARLIERGADINTTNKNGDTPFSLSCKYGHIEIGKLLIDKGCDIHKPINDGMTPLMNACRRSHLPIVARLIERGADINTTDKNGDTQFSLSCKYGIIEIVNLLIDKGCDIHKPDNDGMTPLMNACHRGHLPIVARLIERGADINITDKNGETSFTWASKGGNNDIVNLLLDKVFDENKPNDVGKPPLAKGCDNEDMVIDEGPDIQTQEQNVAEPSVAFPWIGNPSEFKVILSKGVYESFDNRVFLSGACNCGKSTLASVLIGADIPKTWESTDGLVVYFGRNGINLKTEEMLPLTEGTSSNTVYSRILRGQPNILQKKVEPSIKKSTSRLRSFVGKIRYARKHIRMEDHKEKENKNVDTTILAETESFTSAPSIEKRHSMHSVEENIQETSADTPDVTKLDHFTVREDILEEVRKGRYIIEIAPSDLVDFGGQRSYDMTHQLFIQHQGSFIIMFDGSYDLKKPLKEYPQGDVTSESIIIHWINSILAYCPEDGDIMPMVLFVATHSDSFTTNEEADKRKEKFKKEIETLFLGHEQRKHIFLDRLFFIDGRNSNDPEIKAMTQQLVKFAMQQSTWGQKRPMAWVPLELQIDDMRSHDINIITRKKLEDINKLNKDLALTDAQLEDFLRNQHTLGKVMYYNQPGLDGFVIIHTPALVNIMRSFITDEMFWPDDDDLKEILQNLALTGNIYKSDLWKLWSQHSFKQYLPTDVLKDFVTKLLIHLDILIHLKEKRSASRNEMFLVPCIIKTNPPLDFFVQGARDSNTIVLAYSLTISSIPSALAFKLIGAVSNNFSLKEEDGKRCLFHKAAIFMADDDNEIRIGLGGNRIKVNLINRNSLQFLSPDIAASVQECLTKTLKSSLAFYYQSNGKQIDQKEISRKFSIEVGLVCQNTECLLNLDDAFQVTEWTCKRDKRNPCHKTKYPLYWVFDRKQKECDKKCSGLTPSQLKTVPSNKHLIRLACKFQGDIFDKFIIHLGLEENEYWNIKNKYRANDVYGSMFMALVGWRINMKLESPSLKHIRDALKKVDMNQHLLCQIFREDLSLIDFESRLQSPVEDEVLKELPKHIGDCIIHLGVELGLTVEDIQEAIYNNQEKMYIQTACVLKTWKTKSQSPWIFELLKALQHVKCGGWEYVCDKYNLTPQP